MSSKETAFDLFLSYRTQSSNFVRAIADVLISNGLNIWFAEYRFLITESLLEDDDAWKKIIREGIENSERGLIFTDDRYIESSWCKFELEELLRCCGGENIIEIMIPENSTRRKYIGLGQSTCLKFSDPPPGDINGVLNFLASELNLTLKTDFSSSNVPYNRRTFVHHDEAGYVLDTEGWQIIEPPSHIPNEYYNLKGPCLVRNIDQDNKLVCDLTIGPLYPVNRQKGLLDPLVLSSALTRIVTSISRQSRFSKMPGSESDWSLRKQALQFAKDYMRVVKGRVIGTHIFYFSGLHHFGITYKKDGLLHRRFAVTLNDPESGLPYEFAFVFVHGGDLNRLCMHSQIMEELVFSLKPEGPGIKLRRGLLQVVPLLFGAVLGYVWKETFLAAFILGTLCHAAVGIFWAFALPWWEAIKDSSRR